MEVALPEPMSLARQYARFMQTGPQTNTKDLDIFRLPTVTQVKTKSPRKSKIMSELEEKSEERNGTCEPTPLFTTATLPKRLRIDTPATNGIIPTLRKSSPKPRKERIPKTPPNEKPKRKYTKRKIIIENQYSLQDDQNEIPTNLSQEGILNLSKSNSSDNQWLNSRFPSGAEHGHSSHHSPPGLKSPQLIHGHGVPMHASPKPRRIIDEGCEMHETRVPNNNTHLLLSPQTLKRMLRSPSPASQSANVTISDEDLDEEIMQASNSLFKDMSLRRWEEAGSPSQGSYASSSSTTSSSPHGRGRYSRRKFGRLYPSFDPNHCLHSHCFEGTLTGSRYCAAHAKGHLPHPSSSLYSQCIYTDPFSLKLCKKTVYGEDEREFKFCGIHAERVTATRLRVQRREQSKLEEETMDSVMEDLEKCLVNDDMPHSLSLNRENTHDSPLTSMFHSEAKDKDDLKDFFSDIGTKFSDQSRNLLQFSRFQPDQDSDEDIVETGDDDPLKHAGYYSTDEVISIYRSRLDKLRRLYQTQFSGLKHIYMDCRQRYAEATDRNEQRKFSFTSDPKFISVKNSKLMDNYKEDELDARERSLMLTRYRHRFGAKKAVHLQAMRENEKYKIGCVSRDAEALNPVEDSTTGRCTGNSYYLNFPLQRLQAFKAEKTGPSGLTTENVDKSPTSCHSIQRPCIFTTDTVPCSNLPLPLSNYCKAHILNESDQMLYVPCGRVLGDSTDICVNPTLKGLEKCGCMFHSLAEVSDPKPSDEEIRTMSDACLGFPAAEAEEEQEVLEGLVAKETFSITQFDRAVRYLGTKGYEVPDTEESDAGEEEEEDEAFKNLLLDELRIVEPKPNNRGSRRSNTKRKYKVETESPDIYSSEYPSLVTTVDTNASIDVRYVQLLPTIKTEDVEDPQPTLVLLTTD